MYSFPLPSQFTMFWLVKWPVCSVESLGLLTQSILFSCLQLKYRNHINVYRLSHLNPWIGKASYFFNPRRWAAKLSWIIPETTSEIASGFMWLTVPVIAAPWSSATRWDSHDSLWCRLVFSCMFYCEFRQSGKNSESCNCTFHTFKTKGSW